MSVNAGRLLFLTDRDIYDGLCSAKQQVTVRVITEFFRDRGIYISERLSREKMIAQVSLLNLDYHEVQSLIDQMSSSGRKDKMRQLDLDVSLDSEALSIIVDRVKESRSSEYHEAYQTTLIPGGDARMSVNVEYDEIDLSRTRLRQRKRKDASIEVEQVSEGQVRIRFPDNGRSEDIVSDIQKSIDEHTGVRSNKNIISLANVLDVELRTKFFLDVIAGMNGLDLYDVTKVTVDSRIFRAGEGDDDSVDEKSEGVDEETVRQMVKKAALSGSNLLSSDLYSELFSLGFYISKMAWHMIEVSTGDKIEFDAFFSDAPTCEKFACQVTGFYSKRGAEHIITRKRLPSNRAANLLRSLEDSAVQSHSRVVGTYLERARGQI